MDGIRYFRPKSLTWWSGIAMIGIGAASLILPDNEVASELAIAIRALTGEGASSPGMMIGAGLGLIGIRDAIHRGMK